MSAETVAPPAAVDQGPADRDPVADALEEFAAFRTDADAALVDARRRREAAAAEARRLSRPGIRPPDGWPDDE